MENDSSNVEVMQCFEKSKFDQKQYRMIRLFNQMEVLLVYDDKVHDDEYCEFWPSCALTIAVGSLSDPTDLPGLAKLVAHILGHSNNDSCTNMGRWLGRVNSEVTTIAFKSRTNSLDDALAHLARLLKASIDMTKKQEEILDYMSLYSYYFENVTYFAQDKILSMLGNVGHPSQHFERRDMPLCENISQRIDEFKNRHYSAHRMRLCLQTHLPLDQMQELVEKHFSSVPNNELPGLDFTPFTHANAFQSKFHENVYFVKAQDDYSKIILTWCVPPETPQATCKPNLFLKHIMEIERDDNFRIHVRASEAYPTLKDNGIFSLFSIEVVRIGKAPDCLEDLVEGILSYLRQLLKKLKQCDFLEQLYHDFESTLNVPKIHEVERLANVQRLVSNFSTKHESIGGFDAGVIHEAIDALSSPNFNVIVISRDKYVEGIEFELEDESLGMKYTERKKPDKWISLWNNPTMFAEISLPTPSPYIAHDFTILYDGSPSMPKSPIKVYESDVSELWHRQDDKFLTPDVCCYFYFQSPLVLSSVKNSTMAIVFAYLLNTLESRRTQYIPRRIYVDAYFEVLHGGIVLKMKGPHEKLQLTMNFVTEELKKFHENVKEEDFREAISGFWITYNSMIASSPEGLADDIRMSIIRVGYASSRDIFRCKESIEFSEMQDFCSRFFDRLKISALIQGNITADEAKSVIRTVETNLGSAKIEEPRTVQPSARLLPPGTHNHTIKCPEHYESATVHYYQIGPKSLRSQVLIKLFLKIAANLLETNIESKRKLTDPYFSWNSFDDYGILGYSIAINSRADEDRPNDIAEFNDEWNFKIIPFIENLSVERYDKIVSSMKNEKMTADHSMEDETDRNWLEILNGDYLFDRHYREMEILSTISQSEFLRFSRDHLGTNERRLHIQCIGHEEPTEEEVDPITNVWTCLN